MLLLDFVLSLLGYLLSAVYLAIGHVCSWFRGDSDGRRAQHRTLIELRLCTPTTGSDNRGHGQRQQSMVVSACIDTSTKFSLISEELARKLRGARFSGQPVRISGYPGNMNLILDTYVKVLVESPYNSRKNVLANLLVYPYERILQSSEASVQLLLGPDFIGQLGKWQPNHSNQIGPDTRAVDNLADRPICALFGRTSYRFAFWIFQQRSSFEHRLAFVRGPGYYHDSVIQDVMTKRLGQYCLIHGERFRLHHYPILQLRLRSPHSPEHVITVRALLVTSSERSYISEWLINRLGLTPRLISNPSSGNNLEGKQKAWTIASVKVRMESMDEPEVHQVSRLYIQTGANLRRTVHQFQMEQLSAIAKDRFGITISTNRTNHNEHDGQVDVIIGQDLISSIIVPECPRPTEAILARSYL